MAIELMTSETQSHRKRRLTVIINPTRLEGGALSSGETIRVETKLGLRNKQSLLSPKREVRRASSEKTVSEKGGAIEWDGNDGVLENSATDQTEFELLFVVLRKVEGRDQMREKWVEMGRTTIKIEALGMRKEMKMTRKLPIKLLSCGFLLVVCTLTVVVSLEAEESGGESAESSKAGFFRLMSFQKKDKVVGTTSESDLGELTRSSSVTQSSWKRRGILKKMRSFLHGRRKVEPVVKVMDGRDGQDESDDLNGNVKWQVKVIVSRDGATELKCNVGLGTYDQCSVKVAGEGACSVIAAVVAHWLHLNKGRMPNRAELDKLMVEGATEWKKLGENEAYQSQFPDKHFDIETVARAGIRPLRIDQDRSVIGFFSPEKFELLKETKSVDGIWSDIEKNPGVYIVSWNDHFCVLKVDEEACYVIDSLGERLTEGGDKAFILKFDESSIIKDNGQCESKPEGDAESKPKETSSIIKTHEKETSSINETLEVEARVAIESVAGHEDEEVNAEEKRVICRGRECCKEYFKRFLASIIVTQQEMNAEKGIVGSSDLHKRLQIEFQYTTCVKK